MGKLKSIMYRNNSFVFFISIFFISIILQILPGCKDDSVKPVNITMVSGSVGKELDVLKKQIILFEKKHPSIQVNLMEAPESQNRKYEQYVEWLKKPDSAVDIYVIDTVWISEFSQSSWLLPLDYYIEKNKIDIHDYLESSIRACKWEGHIVALPWFTSAGVLYYRKDLLEKYNYEVPSTWEELKEISREIVKREKKDFPSMVGFVFQADKSEALVTNYLEYVWGEGADVLSPSGEVILNDERAVKALETYSEMIDISAPGAIVFQEEDARNYFQSGNSVFMRNWPYAFTLLQGEDSCVRDKFAIAPIPRGNEHLTSRATLGGWQLAISNYTKYPKECFELIAFLTSAEQQSFKAIKTGQNPSRKFCYSDKEVIAINPSMTYLFDIILEAYPRPIHPRYNEISKIIQQEVHLTLKGEQSSSVATENMSEAITKIISKEDLK